MPRGRVSMTSVSYAFISFSPPLGLSSDIGDDIVHALLHGSSGCLQQEVGPLEVEGSVDMQDEISFSITIDITIDVRVSLRLFVAELAGGV